jgi:hypothetical protein
MGKMDALLKFEFDINYINIISRKNIRENAAIRLIISSLATSEEIKNIRKKDIELRTVENPKLILKSVKTRVSPVDEKTYRILVNISREKGKDEKIFGTDIDLDRILEKYSPKRAKYNVKKFRNAVIELLRDCLIFGEEDLVDDLIKGKNLEKVSVFLRDFNPLYSGMWDIDDDEVAREFILSYISYTGVDDPEKIAEVTGESKERILRLIKSEG